MNRLFHDFQILVFSPRLLCINGVVAFISAFFLISCEEPLSGDEVAITTGEILYLSGDRVTLEGTIHSLPKTLSDHGFEVSEQSDFSEPGSVHLGEASSVGRFLGTIDSLSIGRNYYYRAFARTGNQFVYGETGTFQTLNPRLISFDPGIGGEGKTMLIKGANFTDDTKIYFDGIEAPIIGTDFQSIIRVRIPPISQNSLVNIDVVSQDTLMTFPEPFEYIIGKWEKSAEFIDWPHLFRPVFFEAHGSVYLGYGQIDGSGLNDSFRKIDKETLVWSSLPAPPGGMPVDGALNFTNGFGTGRFGTEFNSFKLTDTHWTLSQNDEWVAQSPLPFRLYKSISVELLDKPYVFGGVFEDKSESHRIFKLDQPLNEWEVVSETLPFEINSDGAYFSYQDQFYFLDRGEELWRFDPIGVDWELFLSVPFVFGLRNNAILIEDRVYIVGRGLGFRVIMEVDLNTRQITEKVAFPGDAGEYSGAIWTYNNKIFMIRYVGANSGSSNNKTEIWQFDPEAF